MTEATPATEVPPTVKPAVAAEFEKGTKMSLVEVETNTRNLSIGSSGVAFPAGKSRALVPESDIPLLEAATQSPEDKAAIVAAAEQHERNYKKKFADKMQPLIDAGFGPESVDYKLEAEKFSKQHTGSKEQAYHSAQYHDYKPIISLTIIARDLENPADKERTEKEAAAQAPLAAAVAAAVASALKGAGEDSDMRKELAELRELVGKLQAKSK